MRHIILLLLISLLTSCNEQHNNKREEPGFPSDSIRLTNRGTDVEPLLENTDSLQVLFYDNPYGDPKRYARFFRYTATADSGMVELFKSGLRGLYNEYDSVINCRSEGKAYLFGKGEVVKTVFFSSRCDSCCYLYFIKNGKFLYIPMPENLKSGLKELKSISIVPAAGEFGVE